MVPMKQDLIQNRIGLVKATNLDLESITGKLDFHQKTLYGSGLNQKSITNTECQSKLKWFECKLPGFRNGILVFEKAQTMDLHGLIIRNWISDTKFRTWFR